MEKEDRVSCLWWRMEKPDKVEIEKEDEEESSYNDN